MVSYDQYHEKIKLDVGKTLLDPGIKRVDLEKMHFSQLPKTYAFRHPTLAKFVLGKRVSHLGKMVTHTGKTVSHLGKPGKSFSAFPSFPRCYPGAVIDSNLLDHHWLSLCLHVVRWCLLTRINIHTGVWGVGRSAFETAFSKGDFRALLVAQRRVGRTRPWDFKVLNFGPAASLLSRLVWQAEEKNRCSTFRRLEGKNPHDGFWIIKLRENATKSKQHVTRLQNKC